MSLSVTRPQVEFSLRAHASNVMRDGKWFFLRDIFMKPQNANNTVTCYITMILHYYNQFSINGISKVIMNMNT